jgi:hypothetical protein
MLADTEAADFSTEVGRAKFRLLMEQVDRAARLAKQCSEANAEQIEANVSAANTALMARMVQEAAKRAGLDGRQVTALGVALRGIAVEAGGDTATAERCNADLAGLREQLVAADARRIATAAREEAERLSGLTMPPQELLPPEREPESEEVESEPTPPPRRVAPPPRPAAPRDPESGVRTNHRSDLPDTRDPLLKPF